MTPPDLPSEAHLLSIVVGLALLAVAPRLWRGTRTAASLAIAGLVALAVLSVLKGHYERGRARGWRSRVMLVAARDARSRSAVATGPGWRSCCAALGAWGLAYCALRVAPLVPAHPAHALERALRHSVAHALRFLGRRPAAAMTGSR